MTNLRGRVRAFPHSLPLAENNSWVDVGRLNIYLLKGCTKPEVIDDAQSYWFVGFYIICQALLFSLFLVHCCSLLPDKLDNLPICVFFLCVCEYFQRDHQRYISDHLHLKKKHYYSYFPLWIGTISVGNIRRLQESLSSELGKETGNKVTKGDLCCLN